MNKEKLLHLFLVLITSLLTIDLAIHFFYPDFLINNSGAGFSKVWTFLIYSCYIVWATFIFIVIVTFIYATIKEKAHNKKHIATLNDQLEYVLTDHQKQLLLEKDIFELSLAFNSQETGILSIKEDSPAIYFNVKANEELSIEKELKDYFSKFLNKNITVKPGRSEKNRHWYRTIYLNNEDA